MKNSRTKSQPTPKPEARTLAPSSAFRPGGWRWITSRHAGAIRMIDAEIRRAGGVTIG